MMSATAENQETRTQLEEPLLVSSDATEQRQQTKTRKTHPNVRLTLIYTVCIFAGRSLWSQSVLAAYVFFLRDHDPAVVGYLTGIMGLAQLCMSFPTGYLSDRYYAQKRHLILRVSSVVGLLAVGLTCGALYQNCRASSRRHHSDNYGLLVAALVAWGCYYGITNTVVSALFADSSNARSKHFTQRSLLLVTGNLCGPTVAIGLFWKLGNEWTLPACAAVMMVGQLICILPVGLLCFFRSVEHDNGNEDNNNNNNNNNNEAAATTVATESNDPDPEGLAECHDENDPSDEGTTQVSSSTANSDADEPEQPPSQSVFDCIPSHRQIPVLVALADVVAGLSAGMSIRYFPIFFLHHLQLSPIDVQLLYFSYLLLQIPCVRLAQYLAQRYGRLHVVCFHKWIGATLFWMMIVAYCGGVEVLVPSHSKIKVWIVCVLYVLRSAMINSTSALSKSKLMDHVPTEERGKWSALESVNMFSWSGSAALGGIMVREWGIVPVFCVTASMQFLATLPIWSIWHLDDDIAVTASSSSSSRQSLTRG